MHSLQGKLACITAKKIGIYHEQQLYNGSLTRSQRQAGDRQVSLYPELSNLALYLSLTLLLRCPTSVSLSCTQMIILCTITSQRGKTVEGKPRTALTLDLLAP